MHMHTAVVQAWFNILWHCDIYTVEATAPAERVDQPITSSQAFLYFNATMQPATD